MPSDATVGPAKTSADFLVTDLPGLALPLPFRHYAGHLQSDAEHGGSTFFWFVESAAAPDIDPLVIWLNGGPGDSSINGLLLEHGPFQVAADGTVGLREHTWNSGANVLYVDQPLGTGWSFVGDPGRVRSPEKVAADFYAFLQQFYSVFPSFTTRPLFLTGESFAGHYIPLIAQHILEKSSQAGAVPINLAALAIGNPWIDPVIQYRSNVDFADGTALLGAAEKAAAGKTYEKVKAQILAGTADLNTFNNALISILANTGTPSQSVNMYDVTQYDTGAGFNWPDAERAAIQAYMTRDDVKSALHADKAPGPWQAFSSTVFQDLLPYFFTSSKPNLEDLLGELRVLIYVGQWDLMANHIGLQRTIAALDWSGRRQFARAIRYVWVVDGLPAGYATTWGNLTYVSVVGAGHMVPFSVPHRALEMFQRFLTNRPFDDYKYSTKHPTR